jgi:hypothetical protein
LYGRDVDMYRFLTFRVLISGFIACSVGFKFPAIALRRVTASCRIAPSARFSLQDDIFSPKANHPTTFDHDPQFAFKPLNDPAVREELLVRFRTRLSDVHVRFFEHQMQSEHSDIGPAKLGHALSVAQCVDAKEFFESLEFYLRVRRRIRQPVVVDLACGHGLTGLLFAALEPSVDGVVLVDARRPQSFDAILAAVAGVAPWVLPKVHFLEQNLYGLSAPCRTSDPPNPLTGASSDQDGGASAGRRPLKAGRGWQPPPAGDDRLELPAALRGRACGFVAVHACGRATDRCLAIAAAAGGPVAAMPCCYTGCGQEAPYGVRRMLGKGAAADVDRAYAMERAGYAVDFAAIPRAVTPMNRILVAVPRAAGVAVPRAAG